MKSLNLQIQPTNPASPHQSLRLIDRKITIRRGAASTQNSFFMKGRNLKIRSPANSHKNSTFGFEKKKESMRELSEYEKIGLHQFHQMKIGAKKDITVVNVTRDNINKIDFNKILDSLYVTEPFFDGMPKINFDEKPGYDPNKPRTQFWHNISQQLLGYFAPKDGALLLPRQKIQDDHMVFKKSKVLNHIRTRSDLDDYQNPKIEEQVRKRESQQIEAQKLQRKLNRQIRSSTIHNSFTKIRRYTTKQLQPKTQGSKQNKIAFTPLQDAEIERGIAKLEQNRIIKKGNRSKSLILRDHYRYEFSEKEYAKGIDVNKLRRKSCFCTQCGSKQFIYKAEIFDYIESLDYMESDDSFLSTDRGQIINTERKTTVPFKTLLNKASGEIGEYEDSPMILRKKATSYMGNIGRIGKKSSFQPSDKVSVQLELQKSHQISEESEEQDQTKPIYTRNRTLKRFLRQNSPRKSPKRLVLNKNGSGQQTAKISQQNLDFQAQVTLFQRNLTLNKSKLKKRTKSQTDLLCKPLSKFSEGLSHRLLQINDEDNLIKRKLKPKLSMKALNQFKDTFLRFKKPGTSQGMKTVVNSPRTKYTESLSMNKMLSRGTFSRPLSPISSIRGKSKQSNSKFRIQQHEGKSPFFQSLKTNRFSIQGTTNDMKFMNEVKHLLDKFDVSKDTQTKSQNITSQYFPEKKASFPQVQTSLNDVKIICHKRNHLQKVKNYQRTLNKKEISQQEREKMKIL